MTGEMSVPLLAAVVATAVVAPMLMVNHTARSALRTGRTTTFEISAAGVAGSSAESRHSYAWQTIRSVEELPGQLVFRLSGSQFLPMPTKGLTRTEIDQALELAAAGGVAVRR